MQYIVFFCVFSRFTKKHGSCEIVNLLISILGVLLLFTDSLMLVIPYNFFDADEFYWVGNKFLVSYQDWSGLRQRQFLEHCKVRVRCSGC